jgi:hypothetical protein
MAASSRGRAATLLAAVFLLGAGCSTATEVADTLEDRFAEQLGPGITVTCPKDAASGRGEKFDCTATADGDDVLVHVVFSDGDSYAVTMLGIAAPAEDLIDPVTEKLDQLFPGTGGDVDCGDGLVFVATGDVFECTVMTGFGPLTATVTAGDDGAIANITLG